MLGPGRERRVKKAPDGWLNPLKLISSVTGNTPLGESRASFVTKAPTYVHKVCLTVASQVQAPGTIPPYATWWVKKPTFLVLVVIPPTPTFLHPLYFSPLIPEPSDLQGGAKGAGGAVVLQVWSRDQLTPASPQHLLEI